MTYSGNRSLALAAPKEALALALSRDRKGAALAESVIELLKSQSKAPGRGLCGTSAAE